MSEVYIWIPVFWLEYSLYLHWTVPCGWYFNCISLSREMDARVTHFAFYEKQEEWIVSYVELMLRYTAVNFTNQDISDFYVSGLFL